MNWTWEYPGHYSKLSGFVFGAGGIEQVALLQQIKEILNKAMKRAKMRPHSFMARVLAVNHLMMGSLWYLLTLWSGTDKELHEVQMLLINFLWAGQDILASHRINCRLLALPKSEGGVGLILFKHQVKALAAHFIFFTVPEGNHPLQLILRSRINEMSVQEQSALYHLLDLIFGLEYAAPGI